MPFNLKIITARFFFLVSYILSVNYFIVKVQLETLIVIRRPVGQPIH